MTFTSCSVLDKVRIRPRADLFQMGTGRLGGSVIYMDVTWHHDDPAYPVRLVSELNGNRWELRKLEFYSDGRVGVASKEGTTLDMGRRALCGQLAFELGHCGKRCQTPTCWRRTWNRWSLHVNSRLTTSNTGDMTAGATKERAGRKVGGVARQRRI